MLNSLLQILDDGRLTDAQGRVVSFENTVIVMTSNAGSQSNNTPAGFGRTVSQMSKDRVMKALEEIMRPEFLNRIDEIIAFNQLSEDNFRHIAEIMLGELRTTLADKDIRLTWDDSLLGLLTEKSYSIKYGARNLRRLIEKEIENPLVEYTSGKEEAAPITYKETERFYNGTDRDERRENELYEIEDSEKSLEDLVNTQLQWEQIGETERKIVDFCIQSLEQSGYLMIPPKDIAKDLGVAEEQVEEVLSMLKELEPQGLFASGLEECLLMQVRGMDEEELLSDIIRNHLQDIAEGKISTISRGLKISSAEVRKLIHVIKNLNPRPLNGIGGEKAQYILPDVILEFQDGQWNIELNDKWTGNLQVSDFYIHMMETAQDEELKSYFENKLRRARFIMNAVEQRRTTILGITREILKRQEDYSYGKGQLKPNDTGGYRRCTGDPQIHGQPRDP